MSKNSTIDTPENWDAASEGYAERVAPKMMESFAEEIVKRLELSGNEEVLEVAAGSGALTQKLISKSGHLLVTDFSPKMIEIVRNRLLEQNVKNASFEVMDGQNMHLEDRSKDRVACQFGLMLFPDRAKGFSEIQRVLKPNGRAVISGWADTSRFEAFALFMKAINVAFPNLPKPSNPPVFSLSDPNKFKSEMEAAGFLNVHVEYVSKPITIEGPEEIWGMLTSGARPVKMMFDKIGTEGKDKVFEALKEICATNYSEKQINLINTATIGVGTK